jgi:putative endonuclease
MDNYFVYITTNPDKTVLYTGITNDLKRRLYEHHENKGNIKSFAGKFFCYNLVYFERHNTPGDAISREKQIKRWNRRKKEYLIETINPKWNYFNPEIFSE